jgi:hypothetical protein
MEMYITTALKRRDQACSKLQDLYSRAAHFGLPSSHINEEYNHILSDVSGTPRWVRAYLDGYRAALTDAAYRNQLVYGAFIGERFYSVHRERDDYYEKNGIEPRAFADPNPTKGHYWRESLKPFFVSPD